MASQSTSSTVILVLRLSTLFLLVAALLVLVFNTAKVTIDLRSFIITPTKLTFKDLISFNYLIAVASVAAIYTVSQLPLAIYHVSTGKRWYRDCSLDFDFYADKVVSYLLATAAGAGLFVCADLKNNLDKILNALGDRNTQGLEDSDDNYDKFIDLGFVASALVLLAFLCMAVVSVLSSLNHNSNERKSIFG